MTQDASNRKKPKKPALQKQMFHLHRRLFLLVFATAVLWQALLLVDMRLSQYHQALSDSFKVLLTVDGDTDNVALAQLGESMNQKTDIASVRLFSSQDALQAVRQQNPQLADAVLLLGHHKMPAYFELHLAPQAVRNVDALLANLTAESHGLTPHYNAQHAQLVFITGLCVKLLRMAMLFAALLFLAFMFLVEAYPAKESSAQMVNALLSGLLAGLLAGLFFMVLVYPTGFLNDTIRLFTTPWRQVLLLVFCGLFGWTLSKWQRF